MVEHDFLCDPNVAGQRAAPDGRTDSENSEAEVNEARDEAPRTRTSQCACALLLCIACFGAISMILREAFSGAAKSFYCSPDGTHPVAYPAPLTCAVPLSLAAVLCNLAVVGGLLCILRFAWLSGRNIAGDGPSSLAQLQRHRAKLQKDLTLWRRWSAKVGHGFDSFWLEETLSLMSFANRVYRNLPGQVEHRIEKN